jgi:hypothetical protein
LGFAGRARCRRGWRLLAYDHRSSWSGRLVKWLFDPFAAGQDLPLLDKVCQRAVSMRGGSVRADGPFEGVKRAYLRDQ